MHQQRRWISRNYIRRLAEAEQDVQERARDIGGGRKRSLFDVLEERGYVNQVIGYVAYYASSSVLEDLTSILGSVH